jgi:cytochrome c oxidase subunit 3
MSEHAVADPHAGHDHDGHHSHNPFHAHHFDTPKQQFDAGKFGMWLFLVQEVLFFSGLFVFYAIFRVNHPEIFRWGHQALDPFYGFVNTIVLIFSSLTMAWAVRCAQKGQRTGLIVNLVLTLVCAGIFLCVKYVEYSAKFEHGFLWAGRFNPHTEDHAADDHGATEHATADGHGHAESAGGHGGGHAHGPVGPPPKNAGVFFSIYFGMTGLHAIHVLAGIAAITWILVRSVRGDFGPDYFGPVDYVGLYWHLVDLVWIYLFPMLYLIE